MTGTAPTGGNALINRTDTANSTDTANATYSTDAVEQHEGYAGPATLCLTDQEIPVDVILRGYFEPVDGQYRWYGRIAATPELTALLGGRPVSGVVTTPHGAARGRISDPDHWGRFRIAGVSTPPFPAATGLPADEPSED